MNCEGKNLSEGNSETSASGRNTETAINEYLAKVEKGLKGFTREARDSILSEIEGHILERMEGRDSGISPVTP